MSIMLTRDEDRLVNHANCLTRTTFHATLYSSFCQPCFPFTALAAKSSLRPDCCPLWPVAPCVSCRQREQETLPAMRAACFTFPLRSLTRQKDILQGTAAVHFCSSCMCICQWGFMLCRACLSETSRFLQGMAERGFLPKALAKRSRHDTPKVRSTACCLRACPVAVLSCVRTVCKFWRFKVLSLWCGLYSASADHLWDEGCAQLQLGCTLQFRSQ